MPNSPWQGLGPGTDQWPVRRWPGLPSENALYAGKDAHGGLSILVRSRGNAGQAMVFSTRALECKVTELSIDGLPSEEFLVLRCRDSSFNELFQRFGDEVALVARESSGNVVDATLRVLSRWKRFWTNDAGLTDEAAVGLFGELWFLLHWLGGPSTKTLAAWRGPESSLHDFQFPEISVEVKTTAVKGPLVHHIANLEQLAPPSSGRLLLFSLHLVDDALAKNSLGGLVDRIRHQCRSSEELLEMFDVRLATTGYKPSDQPWRSFRILDEGIYAIRPGFPRLDESELQGGIPVGIANISYDLIMAACQAFALTESEVRGLLAASTLS